MCQIMVECTRQITCCAIARSPRVPLQAKEHARGGVLIYFSIRERAVSNQPLSDSKNRHCKSRGISLQKISYTFGKNPFVFKKNPSKIRMNPFVLKKSRTLFPISELPLAVNHESFFAF